MAADRQRLAQALAAEAARRKMFESIPEPAGQGLPQAPDKPMGWNDYLENLSIGLGRGAVNQMEGIKGLVTSPVESLKGMATGAVEAVRNPRMVAEMLKQTAQRATSGPLGLGEVVGENVNVVRMPGKPVMHELDVYHGTPHRFPATEANPLGEFDASKIGTGEGAQAYGHGVYLAESPNIAKHYQTQLGKFYDQMQTPEGAMSLEEAVTKYHPDGKAAAKVLSTFRTKTDVDTFNKLINDQILPEIRAKYSQTEWDKFAPQQGTLYKADLPDEMIGRMLDWDKPLSKQPAAVREHVMRYMNVKESGLPADMSVINTGGGKYVVVQEKPPLPGATFGVPRTITKGPRAESPEAAIKAYWDNLKGEDFYKTLSGDIGEGAAASEHLRSLGIPGVRYLDAGSRGQGGSGTRNFVVFPGEEKKVRILERK